MLEDVLKKAVESGAADVFIISGVPITFKIKGSQVRYDSEIMKPDIVRQIVREIYELARRENKRYELGADDDFSFALRDVGRFRVNIFRQRGTTAVVIRVIKFGIPDPVNLGIPESVLSLADNRNGLILIAGAAGAGKSTTLACMIDRINRNMEKHIITIEDPIEYVHTHNKSIVSQREILIDTPGYLESLRSALRESPDVILLGEMRDYETISAAITAAETGVLLFSTLHTRNAANTISRILDVFGPEQQPQVRTALAQLIKGVVCQQLVPTVDGRITPVFEVMKQTPAIQNLIREGKLHQIDSVIQASRQNGMITMDDSLLRLYSEMKITRDTLLGACNNYDFMLRRTDV